MATQAMPLPAQTAPVAGPGMGAAAPSTAMAAPLPNPAAEPAAPSAQATKPGPETLADKLNPAARKVLEARLAKKAAAPAAANPAPELPAATPAAQAAAPAAAASTTPAAAPAASDDAKPDAAPDAGIIDFAELTKGAHEAAGDDDAPPAALTEAEANDLDKIKAKLTDAHKDNAKLRKLKREAAEAAETLKAEIAQLRQEQEQARQTGAQAAASGRYLERFSKAEDVKAAHADALAVIKQLTENPDRGEVTLPGNRVWKLIGEDGASTAPEVGKLAFEILDTYEGRLKQITQRSAAEKFVTDKLPALSKAVPEFEKRYQAVLISDWQSEAPKISLNSALGELITSGEYVLVPRGKAAAARTQEQAATTPAAAPKAAAPELPSTPPPVRPVEAGEEDLTELKARARKGDQEALRQWIAKSKPAGKRAVA